MCHCMLENGLYVFVGSYGVLKGLFVLKYKYRPFVYFVKGVTYDL